MAVLTSSSTNAEVLAAYEDSALYDINQSVDEASSFIQACRILLLRRPAEIQGAVGERVRLDMSLIQNRLEKAESWYNANVQTDSDLATSDVRHFSFSDFGN